MKTQTVRLILDVTYQLNGESINTMEGNLNRMVDNAIAEEMLTGSTEAVINDYSLDIGVYPESINEDHLVKHMLESIESGNLALEDIPLRLARYGLMEPAAFIDEMRERMGK